MATPSATLTAIRTKLASSHAFALPAVSSWTTDYDQVAVSSRLAFVRGWPNQVVPRGSDLLLTALVVELELFWRGSDAAIDDAIANEAIDVLPLILAASWWLDLAEVLALESEGDAEVEEFGRAGDTVVRALVRATIMLKP